MVGETDSIYSKTTFVILFTLVIILSYKMVASFLMAVIVGGLIANALNPIQQTSQQLFKISFRQMNFWHHFSYIARCDVLQ